MGKLLFILAVVLFLSALALGDIPKPDTNAKQNKSIDTTLSIRLERDASHARLIIPKSQIKQLRAELEQLETESPNAAMTNGSLSRVQTIVSGALLSLAFIFGGMWFVRSNPKRSKTFVASAVLLACGSIVTMVYGNAGPPDDARKITGKMFSQAVHYYKTGWGEIKLEVSDDARNPVLIVPDPEKKADDE